MNNTESSIFVKMSVFKWFRSLISFHKYQDMIKNRQMQKYWKTDYTDGILYVTDKKSGKTGIMHHKGMIVYQNKKYYVTKKEGLCITAMAEEVDNEYEKFTSTIL